MTLSTVLVNDLEFDMADRLRKSLRLSDISNNEMAEYLEVSRTTVSNWINGRTELRGIHLRMWAARVGLPVSWLKDGTPPSEDGGVIVRPEGFEPPTF
ncbi:helix-turn-helix domain-containing protein [Mycetocola saprophilus]|uniref:helix-turn-helix domain-containing protein n=1 Tax=Mycetocola saprophilus TaxID=76636 RepID=UPI003BF1EFAB